MRETAADERTQAPLRVIAPKPNVHVVEDAGATYPVSMQDRPKLGVIGESACASRPGSVSRGVSCPEARFLGIWMPRCGSPVEGFHSVDQRESVWLREVMRGHHWRSGRVPAGNADAGLQIC
eukprot:14083525-Heterocapsa_arctica.AAC.1